MTPHISKSALDALARHERIALQLSGGRDSLACLYLLREYLSRITVYRLNTGATYPELDLTLAAVRHWIPNFVEIRSDVATVQRQFGVPSDLVPVSHTTFGAASSGQAVPLIQDRYECCARTLMQPMHQRMKDDGITLIIRGQRNADALKSTVRSGDTLDGFEFLFPIEDWSTEQVMAYLRAQGAPIPRFYEELDTAPECMTCSGWWETGEAVYLKRHYPVAYEVVRQKRDIIRAAVAPLILNFIAGD